tara:strand:+ start:2024 stop:3394 length:1371 start_codon:yes stop_codon:yes gene_type:complete
MTYNYFNELKNSFEKCAAPGMEKTGQRWIQQAFGPTKWLGSKALGHRGKVAPYSAGGATAYGLGGFGEHIPDDPSTADVNESGWRAPNLREGMQGVAGFAGAFGLVSPRVLASLKAKTVGRARVEGNWGDKTPQQAYEANLTGGLTPKMIESNMWNTDYLKAMALKAGLVGGAGISEQAPEMMEEWKKMLTHVGGTAANLESQTATGNNWTLSAPTTDADGNPTEWNAEISTEKYLAAMNKARENLGMDPISGSHELRATAASSSGAATKKWVDDPSGAGPYAVEQLMNQLQNKPSNMVVDAAPTIAETARSAVQDVEGLAGNVGHIAEIGATAAEPAAKAVAQLGSDVSGAAGESAAWREDLKHGLSRAAPVGAGALGGYILSQLLGPGVKEDETPSQREKRERLQRIYNLLGATGGGGLGYYLANRFGGGPATKTGRDVKSFKTIARLGRVSAH